MEVFVMGTSQVKLGRSNRSGLCSFTQDLFLRSNCNLKGFSCCRSPRSISLARSAAPGFCLRASAAANSQPLVSGKAAKSLRTSSDEPMKVFVGLPLDVVSTSNTLNHERAIAVGLQALKLLGVDGVELPIWWGVVENEAHSNYNWGSYLSILEMLHKLDLKVHVSLYFHGSKESKIPLPQWVQKIGSSNSAIYFKDRSGRCFTECLSLSVDELPFLDGKTSLEVYREFCESFKSTFSSFLGSTITGLSIGLGPDGELKYPSMIGEDHDGGEFQCYDENLLRDLKHHAENTGNPLWGLGGPHDASCYHQSPISSGFFAENGGSWDTPYGEFFLSWYSNQLIRHGNRMLSLISSTFKDVPISLSGKIPLMHSFYKSRSHPSELTAGFYNTVKRNGYDAIAEVFSKNSCMVVVSGFDLSEEDGSQSSPEALLAQIMDSCKKNECKISGQNSSAKGSFELIKKNLSADHSVEMFTYQRMGAPFFSPQHFPAFTRFIRALTQPEQSPDDSPAEDQVNEESQAQAGLNIQMQVA